MKTETNRDVLVLDPIFTERFGYAETITYSDGSRVVALHRNSPKDIAMIVDQDRYRLSVDAGYFLSRAEYDRWLEANGPTIDDVEVLAEVVEVGDTDAVEAAVSNVLPLHPVAVKKTWTALGDGFYQVKTKAAFRQAIKHFSSGDFESCQGEPVEYPALVAFSYNYGARSDLQAKCLPMSVFVEGLAA